MKISVVTVCFNSEKTIERTLQSFIAQDHQDKELIVIDGASKDRTLEILEKYRSHISVLVTEKDQGIYDAMNKGWKAASGEFVHFLNSDDWYTSSDVLSRAARYLDSDHDIYHGRLIYQHESGHQSVLGGPCVYEDLRFELRGIHQPASFFRRSLFEKWGGFDVSFRIASDYELIRRFVKETAAFFIDLDVVFMSDSGASAKQIQRAVAENYQIAIRYGESSWRVQFRALWVRFWLMVRYRCPHLFRILKKIKSYV